MLDPELLAMALSTVTKQADGTMAGGIPPMPQMPGAQPPAQDPNAQPSQAPPQQPGAAPGQIPGMDPMTAAMGMPQQAAAPAAPPKLKPEQMMQMLDMRMYNMQQQMTAIAHAVGAKIDMAALVLPPGMQGAPPAETAIPGGPMDPMQNPNAQPGGPGGAAGPGAAPPGGAPAQDPAAAAGGAQPKMASADTFLINGQEMAAPEKQAAVLPPELVRQRERARTMAYLIRSHYENQGP